MAFFEKLKRFTEGFVEGWKEAGNDGEPLNHAGQAEEAPFFEDNDTLTGIPSYFNSAHIAHEYYWGDDSD